MRATLVPASAPPVLVAPASARPWLFNAPLDLLVGCGAWSLPFLALVFWLQRDAAGAATLALAFYALGLFCNNPHYMATLHRAYHTAGDFAKYRFFTVYVTALLALVVVLVHLAPGLVPWVVTLYLTWSPWHYTGQNSASPSSSSAAPARPPIPPPARCSTAATSPPSSFGPPPCTPTGRPAIPLF